MELQAGDPEAVGMSVERVQRIAPLVESWIKPGLHQSIVVLAARRGQVVLHEAFGTLTPEPDSAPTRSDSLFPVSSLSKVITASSIMILVERGLLSLYSPVVDFIPELSGKDKDKVLVWHLLTHTAGGFRMEEMDAYLMEKKRSALEVPPTPEGQHPLIHEFLCLGYDAPLANPPGTSVGYSNYGFELLGETVRRVSGKPLGAFAQENILAPLGMNDTGFVLPGEQKHRLVRRPLDAPYAQISDVSLLEGIESESLPSTPWACGGVHSTAMDMAIFGQMFLNDGCYGDTRILSPVSVRCMRRNQTTGLADLDRDQTPNDASRGLGWDIPGTKKSLMYGNLYSPDTYGHSGAGGALIWIDPEHEIVGVYLSIELSIRSDLQRNWSGDLFANAVTAAIVQDPRRTGPRAASS